MKDSDFRRLEKQLGLKLPAAYVNLLREFPNELRDWPRRGDSNRSETFLSDVDQIVQANQNARRLLRREFPSNGFVFGRHGDIYWLIEVGSSNPKVQLAHPNGYLVSGFPSLAALYRTVQAAHKEAWDRERRPARTSRPSRTLLTAEELLAEGRRLARPAVVLTDEGKKCIAIWQGSGMSPPPGGPWRHWISLDVASLPGTARRLGGVASVYECFEDSERMGEIAVIHTPNARLPRKTDGQRLFGEAIECLPPIGAVFRYGSSTVQQWLEGNNWKPTMDYNDNFPDQAPVEPYQRVFFQEHPFYGHPDAYAMLGGWSIGFEQDWEKLSKKPLVVLTIEDSEPWIEVYQDGKKFVGHRRNT